MAPAMPDRKTVEVFDRDIRENGGYGYTTNISLSSQLATKRWHEALLSLTDVRGTRIIDVGCGDGMATVSLYDLGRPASIHALDPAEAAVSLARSKAGNRAITYSVLNGYSLPFPSDSFDIAHLGAMLHHVEQPLQVIKEALRVAPKVLVLEPNGWNPVLKLLERYSKYHIEHGEKSYTSGCLARWFKEAGGKVTARRWAGLVPMFCPDFVARTAKFFEPVVERIPVLNTLTCAIYVFVAERCSVPAQRRAAA